MWRLPQERGIYSESTRNSLRAFIVGFWFEVQQVKDCDLPIGFQFAGEQWRTDAAQA
jgi:hypothetical protein